MRVFLSHPCLPAEGKGVLFAFVRVSHSAASLLIACALCVGSTAQVIAEQIPGTVINGRTGSPLPGVMISTDGHRLAETGPNGKFVIASQDSGSIVLRFRKFGFEQLDTTIVLSNTTSPAPLHIDLHETVFSANPIVTTATRSSRPVDAISATVDVVQASDIRARASVDVGELLSGLPGVVSNSYGALGDVRTISLRGSTASQVLILLDGERLNSAQSGEVDLSVLPMLGIQRVEVLRGGASAQYGADAMGGAVNIVTSELQNEGVRVSMEGLIGSFGTRSASVGGTLGAPWGSLAMTYRDLHSDGTFVYRGTDGSESVRNNADVSSHSASFRSVLLLGEQGAKATLNLGLLNQESGDPGMIGLLSSDARKRNANVLLNASFELPIQFHTPSIQMYVHSLHFQYNDPKAYIPVDNDSRNVALGMQAQDKFMPVSWMLLTGGYAIRVDRFSGNSLSAQYQRTLHSVYFQDELNPLGEKNGGSAFLSLVPAVRWDSYQDFGDQVSPKMGLVVSAGDPLEFSIKSNVGRSFRAPTFNDLYWPRDNFSVGNPALTPERSIDVDAGLHVSYLSNPGIHAGITWFSNAVRDLILWQPGYGGIWSPHNVGKAAIWGLELETGAGPLFDIFSFTWSYTWLNARDESGLPNEDGLQLPYRPEHLHKAIVQANTGLFHASAEFLYMSRRYASAANTVYLLPFHTIDLSAGLDVNLDSGTLSLLLTFRNIENTQYQMIEGYPVPGREARLTAGYTMSLTP